ncbi:hypothetical protein GCM10017771_03250 [Streptomyces capitiformicae]|uniref:Uncharacterized protein n=1 Tax=Streptomyces capitiformicae TaxID=2014920 RepID=A0A919GBD6_9ACTN|nr:hypothetical protein GCM10017771_03250 [Streptomyces capitiformicae]
MLSYARGSAHCLRVACIYIRNSGQPEAGRRGTFTWRAYSGAMAGVAPMKPRWDDDLLIAKAAAEQQLLVAHQHAAPTG